MGIAALRDGPKGKVPEVRNAYRYLRGAHRSVDGLFSAAQSLTDARRLSNATDGGRLHTDEVNVLRAAIMFTSSGLDASMKRLINDAGRYLITRPDRPGASKTGARGEYEGYLKTELNKPRVADGLKLAIADPDPAGRLLSYYLSERSRASFQGSGDLRKRVRNAIGISQSVIPDSRLTALDPFFQARNSIAHSMDYANVHESSSTKRNHRTVEDASALCELAFEVAAELMHAAADVILAAR